MSAEFDPKKDAANLKKHGVSLSEGDGVLNDPLALTVEDDLAAGEQGFVTLRMNAFLLLIVVFFLRVGGGGLGGEGGRGSHCPEDCEPRPSATRTRSFQW